MAAQRRLLKEYRSITDSPPPGIRDVHHVKDSLYEWLVQLEGAPNTLYSGEHYRLKFKFSERYPFDSPQVMFVGSSVPVHPHIYSNGHICLSILTDDWSPALTVESVCISIISMMSSCKEKKPPIDNSQYTLRAGDNPKKTSWWYHDDDV